LLEDQLLSYQWEHLNPSWQTVFDITQGQ